MAEAGGAPKSPAPSRKTREGLLANGAMILILLVALLPIATTILIRSSVKRT